MKINLTYLSPTVKNDSINNKMIKVNTVQTQLRKRDKWKV